MIQKAVPGYTEMFGPPKPDYDELLKGITPRTGIVYCITLNNELNAALPYEANQARLMQQAQSVFTLEQKLIINANLYRLCVQRNDPTVAEIFHKSTLLAMLVKELNRAGKATDARLDGTNQFPLLVVLFLVIEEEHAKSRPHLDDAIAKKNEPLSEYRIIWAPLINQFHFQEWVSPMFEVFKVFCLLKYSFDKWREHLRTYLAKYDIKQMGVLVGSYRQLLDATTKEYPENGLRKHVPIVPKNDAKHLQYLAVNSLIGKKNIAWPDLKKKPLYHDPEMGYLVIDKDFLFKHIFRGPYFDLRASTKLKDSLDYNNYSNIVSTDVMEKMVLRPILRLLQKGKGNLQFDEGPDGDRGVPDACYFTDNIVVLFESKAYIFPDDLSAKPNFDNLVNYLNERLIEKDDGTSKGVGQLIKNIETIFECGYSFHKNPLPASGKLIVYPIIVHNDFQFALPGINNYLNENFRLRLPAHLQQKMDIRDLTLINMDWLFDLSMRDSSLQDLQNYIDRYHILMRERKQGLHQGRVDGDQFLRAQASFDETYQFTIINDLPKASDNPQLLMTLIDSAGLTKEILDAEV